ncbi:MAG: sulfotransferase domain-containing protein [Candidatus Ozemobacteraceae bacterium]
MHGIVWIASFPKSGNTWFRIFLDNYLKDLPHPIDINSIGIPSASDRDFLDRRLGFESSNFTLSELASLRRDLYINISRHATETPFLKVHDAYSPLPDGISLIPKEATSCVVYLVRNPFDVAVSLAHFQNEDLDSIIEKLSNPSFGHSQNGNYLSNLAPQKIGTWSDHFQSWVDQAEIPVLVIRFEDLKAKPFEAFFKAVQFLELTFDQTQFEKALEFSKFNRLQEQERQKGFREKPAGTNFFFREGRSGGWRTALSQAQVSSIKNAHSTILKRLGYLDDSGEILC